MTNMEFILVCAAAFALALSSYMFRFRMDDCLTRTRGFMGWQGRPAWLPSAAYHRIKARFGYTGRPEPRFGRTHIWQ